MLRQLASVSFFQPASSLARAVPPTLFVPNSPFIGRPWSLSYADFDVVIADASGVVSVSIANQAAVQISPSLNLRELLLYSRQLIFDQTQAAYVINPFKERVALGGILVESGNPLWMGLANASYQLVGGAYPSISVQCTIVGDVIAAGEAPGSFNQLDQQGRPKEPVPPLGRPRPVGAGGTHLIPDPPIPPVE